MDSQKENRLQEEEISTEQTESVQAEGEDNLLKVKTGLKGGPDISN